MNKEEFPESCWFRWYRQDVVMVNFTHVILSFAPVLTYRFAVGCKAHRQRGTVSLQRRAERHNVAPFKLFQTSVRTLYMTRGRFLGGGRRLCMKWSVAKFIGQGAKGPTARRLSSHSISTHVIYWGLLCRGAQHELLSCMHSAVRWTLYRNRWYRRHGAVRWEDVESWK